MNLTIQEVKLIEYLRRKGLGSEKAYVKIELEIQAGKATYGKCTVGERFT